MAKREPSRRRTSARLTAANADRHVLYEAAVQSVGEELDYFQSVFRRMRGRAARSLREDFCGTAAMACAWIRRHAANTAVAVDLDRSVVEWTLRHHVRHLGPRASRLTLLNRNVLDVREPEVDILAALNYSYSVFRERDQLRRYLRVARASLKPDGILFLDAFGGTQATTEGSESRRVEPTVGPDGERVPSFTYVWDQVRFNPIDHRLICRIHFRFTDGTRIDNAFRYDWRHWTLPELQELVREAGFRSVEVHMEGWDEKKNEANGVLRRRTTFEEMAGWVGYVVGIK